MSEGMDTDARPYTTATGRTRREASWKTDYEDYNAYTGLESSAYSGAGGIFKGAAIEILKQEKRLMTTGEITKLALDRKLVRCQGKTPENTMASALYTDVRKRGQYSPFIKPKEGLFGLKSWLNEPWLLDWLSKEAISVADFLPEFAAEYSPPTKRPRHSGRGYPDYQHMVTRGPRGSGGGSDDEQSEEGGEDTAAAGAGAGAAATDSDEQKSNLALLLEAADEIDRAASGGLEEEDDRKQAPAKASKPAKQRKTKAARDPMADYSSYMSQFGSGSGKPAKMGAGMNPYMNPYNPYLMSNPFMAAAAAQMASNPMMSGMTNPMSSDAARAAASMFPAFPGGTGVLEPSMLNQGSGALSASDLAQKGAKESKDKGGKAADKDVFKEATSSQTGSGAVGSKLGAAGAHAGTAAAGFGSVDMNKLKESVGTDADAADVGRDVGAIKDADKFDKLGQLSKLLQDTDRTDQGQPDLSRQPDTAAFAGNADARADGVGTGVPSSQAHTTATSRQTAQDAAAAAAIAGMSQQEFAAAMADNKAAHVPMDVVDGHKINVYRQHILFLERVLGNMHPQVGKAYVFLARVLQHEGSRWSLTMAQRALLRAWQILAAMKTKVDPDAPTSLENFSYLMGHLQEVTTASTAVAAAPPAPSDNVWTMQSIQQAQKVAAMMAGGSMH